MITLKFPAYTPVDEIQLRGPDYGDSDASINELSLYKTRNNNFRSVVTYDQDITTRAAIFLH